jgi:hypothetical protein
VPLLNKLTWQWFYHYEIYKSDTVEFFSLSTSISLFAQQGNNTAAAKDQAVNPINVKDNPLKGDIRVHDPVMIRQNNTYLYFLYRQRHFN